MREPWLSIVAVFALVGALMFGCLHASAAMNECLDAQPVLVEPFTGGLIDTADADVDHCYAPEPNPDAIYET